MARRPAANLARRLRSLPEHDGLRGEALAALEDAAGIGERDRCALPARELAVVADDGRRPVLERAVAGSRRHREVAADDEPADALAELAIDLGIVGRARAAPRSGDRRDPGPGVDVPDLVEADREDRRRRGRLNVEPQRATT